MRGGGAGIPLGGLLAIGSRFGWKGIVVALLIGGALMYAGPCTSSDGGGAPAVATAPADPTETSKFVGFVLDDVQETWRRQIPGYHDAHLVMFREATRSGCGTAESAVGPFYCPEDEKVYIDLAFYDELRRKFGAPGDFAQAYVIAHELGHHIEHQRGELDSHGGSIALELEADCWAGAWAKDAAHRGILEVGDIDEALNAATQIGDDTIQRRTQGRVQPETWTHGSAAQRSGSFKRGYDGGAPACSPR